MFEELAFSSEIDRIEENTTNTRKTYKRRSNTAQICTEENSRRKLIEAIEVLTYFHRGFEALLVLVREQEKVPVSKSTPHKNTPSQNRFAM